MRRRRWPTWVAEVLQSKSLNDADAGDLADFVEDAGRRRGRPHNGAMHRAARLAEVILSGFTGRVSYRLRKALIAYASETEGDVDAGRVGDLLNRAQSRRRKTG